MKQTVPPGLNYDQRWHADKWMDATPHKADGEVRDGRRDRDL